MNISPERIGMRRESIARDYARVVTSGRHIVAIVDDNEALGRTIGRLLTGLQLSARIFHSGEEFLQHLDRIEELNCIILDLKMPGLGGLDVLRALQNVEARPSVLVLTGQGDVPAAVEAMKLGATDFIEKPFTNEDLVAAVQGAVIETERARAEAAIARDAGNRLRSLSSRQRQVLQGLAEGKPNKIIAYELGLSIRTVEAYRAQLLDKLGAAGTAEAVRIAVAGGLVGRSSRNAP